jgi:DNA topoisomerase-2
MIQNGSPVLKDFESHYTAKNVKFVLKLYPKVRAGIEKNFETEFKLTTSKELSMNNIHLYGADGVIKRFKNTNEVIREWACIRIAKYRERKQYQLRVMEHDYKILSAKVRFIQDIIDGKLKVMNKKIAEVEDQLKKNNYPMIGVTLEDGTQESASYNYLTRMPIYQLTYEKKLALEKEAEHLHLAIVALKAKSVQQIWKEELQELSKEWQQHEKEIIEEQQADAAAGAKHGKKKPSRK